MPAVTESAIPVQPTRARPRLDSIDVLRDLVMVIMALDHVRDFLSHDLMYFDPTDLTKTHGALFLTRWITDAADRDQCGKWDEEITGIDRIALLIRHKRERRRQGSTPGACDHHEIKQFRASQLPSR
jgi:hypothetical protein